MIKKLVHTIILFAVFLMSYSIIFAADPGRPHEDDSGEWEIVWSESIDGHNVSSKKKEYNDLIVIKVVAKARRTETYYRTVGWAIYTKNTFAPTNLPEDQYIIGSRDIHRSEKWGVVGSPLMDGSEFITTSSEDVINGFNYADFRIDKKDIFSAFMKKGTKFDKSMIQSDGKIKLYISGITGVSYQGIKRGPAINLAHMQDLMRDSGLGAFASSMVKYFNIHTWIWLEGQNVISYYDISTGKRLEFKELSPRFRSNNPATLGTVKFPTKFEKDGIVYTAKYSTMYPWTGNPETKENSMEAQFSLLVKGGRGHELYIHSRLKKALDDYKNFGWANPAVVGEFNKVDVDPYKEENERTNTAFNPFGSTVYVFYEPEALDVVAYDKTNGKALLEAKSKLIDNKKTYEFDEVIEIDGRKYEFEESSYREKRDIKTDKIETLADVKAGKGVMNEKDIKVSENRLITVNADVEQPVIRASYKPIGGITVLSYNKDDGELLDRKIVDPAPEYTVPETIKQDKDVYKAVQISYKLDKDPNVDIAETKGNPPVMTEEDINVTPGNKVILNTGDHLKDHIVRVEYELEKPKDIEGAEYIIPAQHLTKKFRFLTFTPQVENVTPLPEVEDSTHRYSCDGCEKDDKGKLYCPGNHECTIKTKIQYGQNLFDWNDNYSQSVFKPFDKYVFASIMGKHNLTKFIVPAHASGGSFEIRVTPDLEFVSHRYGVDKCYPTFAKYMATQNAAAKEYLQSGDLMGSFTEGLKPTGHYTNTGGEVPISISLASPGNHTTPHGMEYIIYKIHSGCGNGTLIEKTGIISPSDYTTNVYPGTVIAEPTYIAKTLPVAERESKVEKTQVVGKTDKVITIIQSPKEPIKFYPTYKMYTSGIDTWVLGKQQRNFMPIDIFQVEILDPTNETPIKVEAPWSRDAKDKGNQNLKGGYTYKVSANQPVKIKVTSYIHVPAEGYVEGATTERNNRIKQHENLVNQLKQKSSYNIVTNLPESFKESYPSEWKVTNPYKKGGDNTAKSRIGEFTSFNATSAATTKTTISVNNIPANIAAMSQTKQRIDAQLEKKDWYIEKFDNGIEVIKQETIITTTFVGASQVNFIRNGGDSYNTLAKAVGNIPANKHGITLALYSKELTVNGEKVSEYKQMFAPFLFNVRGTLYDDRN